MAQQQTENVSEVNNINSEDSNKNNVNNSNTIQNGTDITKQPGHGSGQQQCNQPQLQQQTHSQMQNTRQMHPQQQTAQQQASQQNSSNMSEKFSASKSPNQQSNPGGVPVSGGPPGSSSNIISNNGSESQHNIYGGGEIPGGIPPPSHYGIPQPPGGGSHHNPGGEQKDIDPYGHAGYSRYHQGGDPNNPEQYRYAHTPILPGKPSSIMSPNRPPQRYVPGQQIQGPTPTLNSLLQSHPPPGQQRYPNNYEGQPQPGGPSGQPQQYGPQGWSHQPRPYSPQMGQSYRTPSPGNAGRGQSGYPVPPSQASGSYPPSPQQSLSHPPSQGPVSSQYAAPYPPRYSTPPGAAGPNHRSQYSAQYSDSSRSWTGPSNSSPAVSPGPTGHPNAPPSPHQVQHSSIPPPSSPGHVPCASPQPPQASSSPHQEMAGQNSNDSSSGGGNSNNAQSTMRPTPSPTGSSGSRSMSPAVGNYAPRPPYPTGGYSSGPSTANQHAPGSNLPQGNNQYGRPMPNHVGGPHPPFPYNQGGWGAPSSPQTSTGMMPNHNQNKGSPIPSQSSMGSPRPPLNYLKQHLQHKGGYAGAPSPTPPPQSFGNGSGGMHPPMGPPHHMGPPHGPPASAMGPPPSAPQNTPPPPGPPQGPPPPPPTTNQQSNIVDNSLAAEHNNVSQDNSGSSSSTLSSQHPVTSVVTTGPDGAPLDEASQQSTISNTSAASTEDPQCATPKSSRKNDPYSHGHLPPPNASPHTGAGAGEDFEMHSPGNWSRTAASPVFNHVPPQDNFRSTTSTKKSDSLCKLYEMDENPERRPWLDKLLSFMEERRTPITACPTISKQPLDLYRLYIYVKERGGFVEVCKVTKSKTWKDIAGLLGIGASSSAAYTLRKHYTKNLLAYECHYDRGGIDPLPIIQQVEAGSKKKATKPTSVPSPAGSSNSQDSFPPNVSGNVSMDGYSNYSTNYPPSAQPDFNATAQRPPSQNNAQTSHPGAPYQPQPNFNQYGTPEQYAGGPPNQYPQTQNQFPPPNRNMFAPYGPETDASGTTPNAFTPYGPRPYNQPPVSNTQTSTTSATNTVNPPAATTYSTQPPSQDYYRQQAEQNQPRRHPDFVKDAQPYPGYVQRPQMYGGWQGSPQQYRNQYPSQQAPPQQQWNSPRPPAGPPIQSAVQQQQQQQQAQAQQQQSSQQQQPPQGAGGTPGQWDHQPQPQAQQPPIRYHPPQGPSQQPSPYQTNQQPPQQQQQQQPQQQQQQPQQQQQQQPQQQPQQTPAVPPGGPPIPQWSQQGPNSQQQQLQIQQPQQQQPQPSPLPMSNATSSPLRPSHRVVPGVAPSGKPSFSMPPPQQQMVAPGKPMPSGVHQSQQQVMSGPPAPPHAQPQNFPSAAANQIQKREIVFPPDSVESTTPVLYKRKRLAKSDVCPVDPWRIFMSLRSGLLAESTWALDILNVLLFDDHAVQYFGLSHLPGLLNLLLEHLQKALIEMFRNENDSYECNKLIEGGCPSSNNTENDVDIGQISSIPNSEDRVVILNTTQNYTLMSRKGIPVRIQNADDDIFVSDSPKSWDFDTNKNFQTETPDCSDAWTYGYTERFPHRGIIDIFKSDIVDIPFARYLKSDNNIKENLKRPSIDKCSDFGDYNKKIRSSSNNNNVNNISNDISKSVSIKEETIDAVEQKHERKETTKQEDNKNTSKTYEQKMCSTSSERKSFDPKTTVKDPATILKRRRLSDYEDECYTRDESSLYLVKDSQDALARRCICLSNIFRNLTFVPGNEVILARSPSFLALLGNLLLLNHEHVLRTHKNRNYDREEDTDFGDSCSSLQGEKEWWWEYLIQIRENMLVAIANIAGHLELSKYEEIITRPILDGLLHWAVCPSAHGQDPFPSCGPNSNLSPQRLALEALCKLCVTDANVDLVIATPPFSRLEKLCSVLTRHLCRNEDQVLREFSVNLLHYLAAADSAMSRTVALQSPCISYLVAFIEQAEQTALGVANQNGINYLRENPDSMGTSLDMLRRAAGTLLHLAKHPDNRPLFMQQEQRLLGLVMSHILDQQVALIISKVLFQVSRGCGGSGSGSGSASSSEKLLQKQKNINSAAERCALNLQTINNYRNEKLMNINNYNNYNNNNSNNISNNNNNNTNNNNNNNNTNNNNNSNNNNNGSNSSNINNNDNNNNSNDPSLLSLNNSSKKVVNEQKSADLTPNENEVENENGNSSDTNVNSAVTSENEMPSNMDIKGSTSNHKSSMSSFKDQMSDFKDPMSDVKDCSEVKTEIKSIIKTEITETTTESSLETGTSTAGDESSSDSSSATVGRIPPSDINAVSSIASAEISALKDATQNSKELNLVDSSSTMSTSASPSVTVTINNTNNIEKFNNNSNSNNNSSSNSNSSSSSNNNSSGNSNSNENANRNLATSITNTTAAVA